MTKFHLISLGCDKNLVDSEVMLGLLSQHGFDFTQDESEAELIIVNTCSFIHDAKQESIDTILRINEYRSDKLKFIIAAGCLSQRYQDELLKELPEVDAIIGTADYDKIVSVASALVSNKREQCPYSKISPLGQISCITDLNALLDIACSRIITTPGHYEYLKIAEGCSKRCTYCAIPSFRGNYRSYPIESLCREAAELAKRGVKELIIVAQETTVYGMDIYGRKALPELLCKLSEIEGIEWIRLLYAYPEEITAELIEVMSTNPKILHYIDMPIQHSADNILKRMGRRADNARLRKVIADLRDRMPDVCIRTTLITGFPGETLDDHAELYDFVNEMEFDRLGVFPYSQEEDTPAAAMTGQIDEDIKAMRYAELMELQQAIVFEKNESLVGSEMDAIIEGYLPEREVYVARTYRDAPDVDGFLFLSTDISHMTGDIVRCLVTGAYEYDLNGDEIYESAQ